MDRTAVTALVVEAKTAKELTWKELAAELDAPLVWSTSALLGQHPLSAEQAERVVALLDLPAEAAGVLRRVPSRGSTPAVPTDPTIYRLYEAVMVYGPAIKEIVHEDFGDGIMSAINFSVDVDRREHQDGDRVVITMDGKFLPYQWTP